MQAAYIEKTGDPEVIRHGDLPMPVPRPKEVLVRVTAAAVNPVDTLIRSGKLPMNLPRPFIVGCDLAGTVEAIGPGVNTFQPGMRVWGSNQGMVWEGELRQGTFAEHAVVHQDWLYPVPDGVDEQQAVAVGLPGLTAHLGLFRSACLREGETVFVNGGTGGVGSMVVQMAKAMGARAITTAGSPQKQQAACDLGADLVLNYRTDDVAAGIRRFTGGQGVQVWFETLREPNFEQAFDLLARRGRMVVIVWREARPTFPLGKFYPRDLTLYGFTTFNATADELRTCALDIKRWLTEGKLRPLIGKTVPLSETATAHHLQEEHTSGTGDFLGRIIVVPPH